MLRRRLTRRGLALSAGLLAAIDADASPLIDMPLSLIQATLRTSAGGVPIGVAELVPAAASRVAAQKVALAAVVLLATGLVTAFGASLNSRHEKQRETELAKPNEVLNTEWIETGRGPDELKFSGRVVTPDGKPLPGAKITVMGAFDYSIHEWPAPKVLGTTNAEGAFEFSIDSKQFPGRFWWHSVRLVASAEGFGSAWTSISDNRLKDATLKLVRDDVHIQGRVVDLQGQPVAGATVRPTRILATDNEDLSAWMAVQKSSVRPGSRSRLF